jgi:secondary thiamine-phosphate synthase enzyme
MATEAVASPAGFYSSTLSISTTTAPEFVDITQDVADVIGISGLRHGICAVVSRHTTAAVLVNEHEPELLKDLAKLLNEIAPHTDSYGHNKAPCGPDELPNGHAHCQALLLPTSLSIPLVDERLVLGRYQRIFLVELDRPRQREVTVSLLGS